MAARPPPIDTVPWLATPAAADTLCDRGGLNRASSLAFYDLRAIPGRF